MIQFSHNPTYYSEVVETCALSAVETGGARGRRAFWLAVHFSLPASLRKRFPGGAFCFTQKRRNAFRRCAERSRPTGRRAPARCSTSSDRPTTPCVSSMSPAPTAKVRCAPCFPPSFGRRTIAPASSPLPPCCPMPSASPWTALPRTPASFHPRSKKLSAPSRASRRGGSERPLFLRRRPRSPSSFSRNAARRCACSNAGSAARRMRPTP